MKNVMLDLETLGSNSNAPVVSIGAVWFDADRLGQVFYRSCSDLDYQIKKLNRVVDGGTIQWWMQQSEEARSVFNDKHAGKTNMVLIDFWAYLTGGSISEPNNDVRVWGNGATFDNVVLSNLYLAARGSKPWAFRNDVCYRTIKNLANYIHMADIPPREGTHHNALDDARYQAQCAQVYLRILKGDYVGSKTNQSQGQSSQPSSGSLAVSG